MSFETLPDFAPLYILPEDNLLGEVIIPCLRTSNTYDCMTGFFHSSALREMAPGLAEFILHPEGKMRLLSSPYLSIEDQTAIRDGSETPAELLARRLEDLYGSHEVSESALVKHTLECLAYLISAGRMSIKLVLVKNGLFHPKIRLFSDGNTWIAVHGSNNLTRSGFITNVEQVSVSRSWLSGEEQKVVQRLRDEFEATWHNRKPSFMRTYDPPEAFKRRIVQDFLPQRIPNVEDFAQAWSVDHSHGLVGSSEVIVAGSPTNSRGFEIPQGLIYEKGDFAHQGQAVIAWEQAGHKGILEMATGSGKTVTSLIAARKLFDPASPLLLVIAAPYLPLVSQWAKEARKFGLNAILPGDQAGKAEKLASVRRTVRNLRLGLSKVECLVVTHDFLCDARFQDELSRFSGVSMLIADEVHDLGTPRFLGNPPTRFDYRMGLSATPIRQYDEEGTEQLKIFFGDVVFRFTLKEAIGKCLVPYNYYVHPTELTSDELQQWIELTDRLKNMGWTLGESGDGKNGDIPLALQKLLIRRRRVLEQAENKIGVLREILESRDSKRIKHTLVYASDKGREQLIEVNRMLMDDIRLRIHQITQEETSKTELAQSLIASFADGDIQVLTAMRVLDEGIDIPEISTAFILASTTVERQWIQRRGRVLRKCPRTNKQIAFIHDFLVIPPMNEETFSDSGMSKILKSELERITEFASLSSNAAAPDGALLAVRPLIERYF
ncbi:MAG: DEAD/DEAH box helicase [Chloroflexi bacterium]|nr:DEAD/DEAH box helicase [Chloroflexota bacterium]